MSEKTDEIIKELGYEPAKTKTNQMATPDVVQNRDLFQTPNYAVDLLIPFVPGNIKTIWEPACGEGKIVGRLTEAGYSVYPSDIRKAEGWVNNHIFNFLSDTNVGVITVTLLESSLNNTLAIITNPPFSLKQKFYDRCRLMKRPFALLIPADYSGWIIRATQEGAEKIIPTRRIDYITPNGLSGATGHTADFHSMWLTWGFGLGRTETFVELSLKNKKENI